MKAAINNLDVKNTAGQKMIARHAPEHKLDETINLFSRGDLKSATRKASALRKKYPNCFNSANVFAACMMTANRLPEAANAYERTVSLEPSYAVGHFNIGVCNQDTNRFGKAIDSYTRALEIDPNYLDAAFNRGGVLKMLGNFSEALTDLCYAHTAQPNRRDYALSYGDCLERLGAFEDALAVYDKFIDHEMEHRAVGCLYASRQHKEALQRLRHLHARDSADRNHIIPHAAVGAFISEQLDVPNPYPFCDPMLDFIKIYNIVNDPAFSDADCANFLSKLTTELKALDAFTFTHTATRSGEQTNKVVLDDSSPRRTVLKELIESAVLRYRQEFAQHADQPFIGDWPDETKTEGWFVSVRRGGFQEMHTHNTAWLSGVFYLQVIENPANSEGAIRFSIDSGKYPSIGRKSQTVVHQPAAGDLVLFPSSLFHGTNPVEQDTDRCCVAFDILPAPAPT